MLRAWRLSMEAGIVLVPVGALPDEPHFARLARPSVDDPMRFPLMGAAFLDSVLDGSGPVWWLPLRRWHDRDGPPLVLLDCYRLASLRNVIDSMTDGEEMEEVD